MGLIVPQTIRVKTSKKTCKHYREKGYEFEKKGDFIEVNVLDLYPGSNIKVKCICDVCGKEIEIKYCHVFENNKNNRLIICNNPICVKRKIEDTCEKKYGEGIINPFQAESVKEKSKQTMLNNYGVEHAVQSEIIQDRMKNTNLERYGCEYAMQNEEIQNKTRNTNLKRHGCENVMQNKEIQNKFKNTCMKRYNVDNPSKAQEIKDKKKNTCQLHFGVDYPGQAQEVKDAIKATCINRHGCECPLQNKEIQNKIKKTWQKRYNVDNPSKAQEIKDKKKNTCQIHFGVDNPFESKEIQDKIKNTWQKNYGENIINPGQAQVVKDKIKTTWKNNYGEDIENPFQVESVKEKSKQTLLKNYGVDNPMKNEEIKNKALNSFQFNGTGPSSRAQRYINYILNGTLNKNICGSLADIYMEKENIIIEHDGSGHFLRDIINGNKTPTKEAILYEKQREDKIINNGYRMIRFIATKDRIPSDEVILNLIEGFKNSDFNVIRINFEEGTIDRDYQEKWYCNFGELRNITKEDLEQFEKQEENTSEN